MVLRGTRLSPWVKFRSKSGAAGRFTNERMGVKDREQSVPSITRRDFLTSSTAAIAMASVPSLSLEASSFFDQNGGHIGPPSLYQAFPLSGSDWLIQAADTDATRIPAHVPCN